MAPAIKTIELRNAIAGILKGADLTALSAKIVRKQLETTFKTDLTSRKQEIDDIVMNLINEEMDDEKESGSESSEYEAPPPKKKNNAKARKSRKADNSDSDNEIDDEAYARKLQEEEKKSLRRAASRNVPTGKRKEPRKKTSEGGPVRETPYNRKCVLSEELAQVVGAPEMARCDVVKKMWAVAKERNLFDPSNKRYVICDAEFFKVFGLKRVMMFSMMKQLKNHIVDPMKK